MEAFGRGGVFWPGVLWEEEESSIVYIIVDT
jgi:hypothetical protein